MAYLEQKYSSSVDWVKTQQELLNIPQYPSFNPIYHQIKGFRRPFILNPINNPTVACALPTKNHHPIHLLKTQIKTSSENPKSDFSDDLFLH